MAIERSVCSEAHAELVGDKLRLWYGETERPSLILPPVSLEELESLATLWRAQLSEPN